MSLTKYKHISSSVKNFKELFGLHDNSNTTYTVPAFQRNYCWDKTNLKELFDYFKLSLNTNRDIFLGIIILGNKNNNEEQNNNFALVDGQQRITTLCLFMLAFYKRKDQNPFSYYFSKKEIKQIILNKTNSNNPKLNLNFFPKADADSYKTIVDEVLFHSHSKNKNKSSNIFKAFKEINSFLNTQTKDQVSKLADVILKNTYFNVIKINQQQQSTEEENKSEHILKIFETINSTGKELVLLDKIKNYLLFNSAYKGEEVQKRYIADFWEKWNIKLNKIEKSYLNNFFESLCCLIHPEDTIDSKLKKKNANYPLKREYFYMIFKLHYPEFELNKIAETHIEEKFNFLEYLINEFYLSIGFKNKDYFSENQFNNVKVLDNKISQINKQNFLPIFQNEFLIFSFFCTLLVKNDLMKLEEYFKIMRLVTALEIISIGWFDFKVGVRKAWKKYNAIIHKIVKLKFGGKKNEDKIFWEYFWQDQKNQINTAQIEQWKQERRTITWDDVSKTFQKEFESEGYNLADLMKQVQTYSEADFFHKTWKNISQNNPYTQQKNKLFYESILYFVKNESILDFDQGYGLDHIVSPHNLDNKPLKEVHSIGNLILLEKVLSQENKKKNIHMNIKIKNYEKSKSKEIKEILTRHDLKHWDDEMIKNREKKIIKQFQILLQKALSEY